MVASFPFLLSLQNLDFQRLVLLFLSRRSYIAAAVDMLYDVSARLQVALVFGFRS